MKINRLYLVLIFCLITYGSQAQERYSIIPFPNKLIKGEGFIEIKSKLSITLSKHFLSELPLMTSVLADDYQIELVQNQNGKLKFRFNNQLNKDEYILNVCPDSISVEASASTGCFYAFQTVRQLMNLTGKGTYRIGSCHIEDKPTFEWRSYMLDEARHFFGKRIVKTILDQMSLLKMNTFHWHLTDDQGWRIQIKKYPLLTEIGAWRDSTLVRVMLPDANDPYNSTVKRNHFAHGGYYTQDDIKEIVDYAAKRHITIIPEIEMPGHASAAIAAYPWLTFNNEIIKVPCFFGFRGHSFNITDPRVIGFIEDVLEEVISLFPSDVIHIGGDEVNYDYWKNSSSVRLLMEKEGLKKYEDLHIYFTNRISKFLEKRGRRMMGWNEILGNNLENENNKDQSLKLAQNAIIHFWTGDPKNISKAIDKGYDVVNSYCLYTYLDYLHSFLSLEKAYSFNPLPDGISPEKATHVLGLGCQMWGEVTGSVETLYYQTFPRIAAYAEVGWTKQENKDFNRFNISLSSLKEYWDKEGIFYTK